MAVIELSYVIKTILEVGKNAAGQQLSRNETAIKVRKQLKMEAEPQPGDFDQIYRYTLVEWGVFKPQPLLEFFREKDIEQAFKQAFYDNDQQILRDHAEGLYEQYLTSGKLDRVEYDPRKEFDAFSAVFDVVVGRTRTPSEVQRDRQLEDMSVRIDEILARFLLLDAMSPLPVEKTVDWEALKPYLELVARRSQYLPLEPLDPAGQENKRISLGQVFINLNAGLEQITRPKQPDGPFIYERYRAALAHIFARKQLILLGDPGSGKSTVLRFLTHCLAQHTLHPQEHWLNQLTWKVEKLETEEENRDKAWQGALEEQRRSVGERGRSNEEQLIQEIQTEWTGEAPVPVFVLLRDFARTPFNPNSPLALWHYICNRLETELGCPDAVPELTTLAQRGQVIFMLDGVDEVPAEQRSQIWQAISALENGVYGGNRWIATCRILSFSADEAPKGLPVQQLQPLLPAQIDQFIESWYSASVELGSLSPEKGKTHTKRLQAAARRKNLRELAANPMLLTIMGVVQAHYGALPDERARLYQMCVETMLLRWQRHKDEDSLSELPPVLDELGVKQEDLERLLWEIAWQAQSREVEREDRADIHETEVMALATKHLGSWSKAEKFITYTEERAHLLVGRGGLAERVYSFPHRTFQEYLAACHIAFQRRFHIRAKELAEQGDMWREVLNLAAGTLVFNGKNRDRVIDALEVMVEDDPAPGKDADWYRVWLAGEMALVIGRKGLQEDEVGKEILPHLLAQMAVLVANGYLTPQQRADCGVALGWLGDPREDVACDVPAVVEVAAGPFLMGSDDAVDTLAYSWEKPQHEQPLPEAYAIGKYPVTVEQYGRFVEDGGYTEKWRNCWTDAGWKQREEEQWTAPRLWDDPQWTVPNHPVVGVSWYEAVAYCNWLKATTGRSFRLPDEAMWEKAARGTDGRIYPWGNKWDSEKLNAENKVGRTTAVGIYPTGKSPFGIYDASGNVLEWCSGLGYNEVSYPFKRQSYEEDMAVEGSRCLRGGAFDLDDQDARAAFRDTGNAHGRYNYIGFRVAEHLFDPES